MNLRKIIKRRLHSIKKESKFWRHRLYLKFRVSSKSKEYGDYLDTQLQRTFLRTKDPLPERAKQFIDKIVEFVDLPQAEILCVGCRNTAELSYFRQKGSKRVVGVDLYSESPDILVMDMHNMTFSEGSFDLIYSSHSLEHAYDDSQVIGEMLRVARDNAVIAIEVPVNYETTAADLHDFRNAENLLSILSAHGRNFVVLYKSDIGKEESHAGTDVAKIIIRIEKDIS